MANYSIPSSTPATGRILTTSSRQSKNSSNRQFFYKGNCQLPIMGRQRPPLQLQLQRWMLDVGRSTFSSSGRVKGAWWPSRSSKPSSPRKWRGRFDSYPLRRFSLVILSGAKRSRRIPWPYREVIHRDSSTSLGMTNNSKGGERDAPRANA